MPIIRSIAAEQPYVLFTEVLEHNNILDVTVYVYTSSNKNS